MLLGACRLKSDALPHWLGLMRMVEVAIQSPLRSPLQKFRLLWCKCAPYPARFQFVRQRLARIRIIRQQPQPRGDDRERVSRARQAAEALFTSKPPVIDPPGPEPLPPAEEPTRKPRVLRIISPAAPVTHEVVEPPARPAPPARRAIPRSQFAGIRTWVKYGMTVTEVAEVYGAAVGDIERILRQA